MNPLKDFKYPEPGSQGTFGAIRKYDIHTGIDLYCKEGEEVFAIESGRVIKIVEFTGFKVNSHWWNDTQAVLIAGDRGVILYGEIDPCVKVGEYLAIGDLIGTVKTVLKKDKGLPMTMLHLEHYEHEYNGEGETWDINGTKPEKLLNPLFLLEPYNKTYNWLDLQWAFDKGLHEGRSREHYKNDPTSHSQSDFEYYYKMYYDHENNR